MIRRIMHATPLAKHTSPFLIWESPNYSSRLPEVDPAHHAEAGTAWQIFPTFRSVTQSTTCSATRRGLTARIPASAFSRGAVYDLYPEGDAPETEWEYSEPADWPPVLRQDFANMAAVQRGMRNGGFRGPRPNPYRERAIAGLHYNLAKVLSAAGPRKLK